MPGIVRPMDVKDDERAAIRRLGERTAAIRRQRGWTQERLAEAVGVGSVTVSRWETGQRAMSVATLVLVSRALGVRLADLLDAELALPAPPQDPSLDELVDVWAGLDEGDRERLLGIAQVIARTGGGA